MTRRNPIAQAHSLRGPAGSGFHGGRMPRERVEVCQECAAILHRGVCPDCTAEALQALRLRGFTVEHVGPHRILTTA